MEEIAGAVLFGLAWLQTREWQPPVIARIRPTRQTCPVHRHPLPPSHDPAAHMPNQLLSTQSPSRSLATADLPQRVRKVLEQAMAQVSLQLDGHLSVMLSEFEQELFRLASH